MYNQLKNHFGTKFPKKKIFNGTHNPEKEILMAYIRNLKTHFVKLPKKEFLMDYIINQWTHIPLKMAYISN